MELHPFPSCCGAFILTSILNHQRFGRTPLTDEQYFANEIKRLLSDRPSEHQRGCHNNSFLIMNQSQKDAFNSVFVSLGYKMILQFQNWNEGKQPLFLYFKEGGKIEDLPFPPATEAKDAKPQKTPRSRL